MKTQEELNALKKRHEDLTEEIRELSEEELKKVTGGEHHINKPGESFILDESEDFELEETLTK